MFWKRSSDKVEIKFISEWKVKKFISIDFFRFYCTNNEFGYVEPNRLRVFLSDLFRTHKKAAFCALCVLLRYFCPTGFSLVGFDENIMFQVWCILGRRCTHDISTFQHREVPFDTEKSWNQTNLIKKTRRGRKFN